jgi:lysozyme
MSNGDLPEALVAESEGLRLTAYVDTKGYWTIGYGHKLPQTQEWDGHTITAEEADNLLTEDMRSARIIAAEFPHFAEVNDVRQAVLISMAFQMGTKPLHWPEFMAALQARDYLSAADAGLDSDWHRQTPARAEREMKMLETGNWAMSA